MMGIASRKLKYAAHRRRRPSSIPPAMVIPLREMPGRQATACRAPIANAKPIPKRDRPRWPLPARQAAKSSAPVTSQHPATSSGLSNCRTTRLLAGRTRATVTNVAAAPRPASFHEAACPPSRPRPNRLRSGRNTRTMETTVPRCTTMSKASMGGELGTGSPPPKRSSSFCEITRCPLLETGTNSVRPCTMPNSSACHSVM